MVPGATSSSQLLTHFLRGPAVQPDVHPSPSGRPTCKAQRRVLIQGDEGRVQQHRVIILGDDPVVGGLEPWLVLVNCVGRKKEMLMRVRCCFRAPML